MRCRSGRRDIRGASINGIPATLEGDGRFGAVLSGIDDGPLRIEIAVQDEHGIEASLDPVTIRIDTTPPTLAIEQPPEETWVRSESVEISGTAGDEVGINTVAVNGSIVEAAAGRWGCRRSLPEGLHTIRVEVSDLAGNTTMAERQLRIDRTLPEIILADPDATDGLHPEATVVRGTVLDVSLCRVTVNGVEAIVHENEWRATVPLSPGRTLLTLEAEDMAGNKRAVNSEIELPARPRTLSWATATPEGGHDSRSGYPREVVCNKTGIVLVLIAPPHSAETKTTGRSELSPFYLGKYEITLEQYRAVSPGHMSDAFHMAFARTPMYPAVMVNWRSARTFSSRFGFRLPTEREWEFACRAGSRADYPWGDSEGAAASFANVADTTLRNEKANEVTRLRPEERICFTTNDGYGQTAPVGSFQPNAFGLYDMIGNAAEWCEGSPSEDTRPVRGGSWRSGPAYCTSAASDLKPMRAASQLIGFRVARDPEP